VDADEPRLLSDRLTTRGVDRGRPTSQSVSQSVSKSAVVDTASFGLTGVDESVGRGVVLRTYCHFRIGIRIS
jgi:hypothetical protein